MPTNQNTTYSSNTNYDTTQYYKEEPAGNRESNKYVIPYNEASVFSSKEQKNTTKPSRATPQTVAPDEEIIDSPAMHKATMRKYYVLGKWYYPSTTKIGQKYTGIASWYGPNFNGKKTSNGEIYDMHKLTAAHKTLPMNTIVKVINLSNNKSVQVRINDRGPFVGDRIIDLSLGTAKALDVYKHGTTKVQLEILGFNAIAGTNSKTQAQFQEAYLDNINLQIGVFSNKKTANEIAMKIQTPDYPFKVVTYDDRKNDRILYRVVLQNFKSEEEALDFKDEMGLKGSFITGE